MALLNRIQKPLFLLSSAFLSFGIATNKIIYNDNEINVEAKRSVFPSYIFGTTLKLISLEYISHDTKELKFSLPKNADILGIKPGEAILASITNKKNNKTIFRPYSPIYDPEDPQILNLVIKNMNNSGASGAFHQLEVGDSVKFRGPLPINKLDFEKVPEKVSMIAGGSGITPIYSVITYLLLQKPNTKISLIYANKTDNDILLQQKLENLRYIYPNRLEITYVLGGGERKKRNTENVYFGRMEASILDKHILSDSAIFLCGPQGMVDSIIDQKGNIGLLKEEEVFVF